METNNNINLEQEIKLICFNNFYKNPDGIRKYLLNKQFTYNDKSKIYEFEQVFNLNNLNKSLKDIMGNNILIKKNSFYININNEDLCYPTNNNDCEWTAIIFLTLHSKIDSGIKLYKLKNNDNDSSFILEDKIGNIFNRVVIFKSKHYSSIGVFGENIIDGNLYQKILFSTIPN